MNTNTTRLGQIGIGIALLGMVLLFVPSLQHIGGASLSFGLVTLGFLVLILSYLIERLRIMGAEYWALGSVIVYLGSVIVSIPMFLFSFSISTNTSVQWFFAGLGIVLIALGFATTKYELNIKLLSAIRKFKIGLVTAFEKFILRVKSSPLVTLIAILILFVVFTFFTEVETVLYPVLDVLGLAQTEQNTQFLTLAVIVLLTLIETREFLWTSLAVIKNFLIIGLQTLLEWLTRFPTYIKRTVFFAQRIVISTTQYVILAFSKLHENLRTILEGLPMLSVIAAVGFTVSYYLVGIEELVYVSIILIIVPASVLFVANPEWVRRRIERVQAFSYQVGQRTKKIYRRNRTLQCRKCEMPVEAKYINCPNCGTEIEFCSICRGMITAGEDFERCAACSHPIHSQHLEDWTRISSKCPWCKETWKPKKTTQI